MAKDLGVALVGCARAMEEVNSVLDAVCEARDLRLGTSGELIAES